MSRFAVGDPLTLAYANALPYALVNDQNATGIAGNSAGNALGSAFTPTIAASTLGVNGDFLWIRCLLKLAAGGGNKRFKILFGSTVIVDTGSMTYSDAWMSFNGYIKRVGATSQLIDNSFLVGQNDLNSVNSGTGTETLANALALDFQLAGTSASDMTLFSLDVWKYPAAA